jgi:hypothetical protein
VYLFLAIPKPHDFKLKHTPFLKLIACHLPQKEAKRLKTVCLTI